MCSYYSLSLQFVHHLYSELSFRVDVLAIASMSETFSCTRGGLHLPGAIFGVLCMPVMLSGPVLAFFKSFQLLPSRDPRICGTLTKFDSTLLENAVCS